jgi:hypothetical protein
LQFQLPATYTFSILTIGPKAFLPHVLCRTVILRYEKDMGVRKLTGVLPLTGGMGPHREEGVSKLSRNLVTFSRRLEIP